jgi:hypothetical protein
LPSELAVDPVPIGRGYQTSRGAAARRQAPVEDERALGAQRREAPVDIALGKSTLDEMCPSVLARLRPITLADGGALGDPGSRTGPPEGALGSWIPAG